VVKKLYYKEQRCLTLVSDFVSVSDEAFTILLLENNFECWCNMVTKKVSSSTKMIHKYTNGGSSKGANASSRRFKGWSKEGLRCFNKLYDLVEEDRKGSHARKWEEDFCEYCNLGGATGKGKKKEEYVIESDEDVRQDSWMKYFGNDGDNEMYEENASCVPSNVENTGSSSKDIKNVDETVSEDEDENGDNNEFMIDQDRNWTNREEEDEDEDDEKEASLPKDERNTFSGICRNAA
jgi:hypothetical protein